MSAITPTTTTSSSSTPSVPGEVHLTNDQTHILSLLRSTNLRISLTTTAIRALRHEAILLEQFILPPLQGRPPSAVAMELLGVSSQEEIDAITDRIERDEQVLDEQTLETAWRYMKLDEVLGEIEGLEKEIADDKGKKAWLEGAYAQTVEYEKRKEGGLQVGAEPEKRPVFDWEKLEVGWE